MPPAPPTQPAPTPTPIARVAEIATALSMTVGRGATRTISELAQLTPDDRLVDLGCGPATAAHTAARAGAAATGVDPSTLMLRLTRLISRARRTPNVTRAAGTAEGAGCRRIGDDPLALLVVLLAGVLGEGDRAAAVGIAGLQELAELLLRGRNLDRVEVVPVRD